MKTITIHVSDSVHAEFLRASQSLGRPIAELVHEAIALYCQERLRPRRSLERFQPRSAGRVLADLRPDGDLLDEMFMSGR